jgi:hypothetical protein
MIRCGVQNKALPFDYGSLMMKVTQSYQVEFSSLFHFVQVGVMMLQK